MTQYGAKQVILVVDDDVTNLRVFSEYLEGSGFEILTARHGEDGIKKARLAHPDLILLDVMMPGIDGFETCRRLKTDDKTRQIPVIFLTALDNVENKVKGFAAGGVDYVTKPLQEDEVLARVRTHLQLQAQKRQVQQQAVELKYAKDEAEAAQRAAEKANLAKSRFIANMSHELRTPLNTILGFSQLMSHTPHSSEEQEYLELIQRSGDHLLALIDQILDLSKIEAGRVTLEEENFDLYALLDNLEAMFFFRTERKGLQLVLERGPELPRYVCTDEIKLRQVLINLLNNAVKFTLQGRISLRVGLCNPDDISQAKVRQLCFDLEDTGPGIAEDEMGKLFETFEQTASGKQLQEGTGLGLTISRKFVQLMGGKISVRSQYE